MADPEKATKVENGIEDEDVEDEEVSTNAKAAMVAELLKNPALFSMMNRDYISSLPAPVKRRLKALKKIQLESTKIEAKFYEEVHKLECKYHELYQPLYQKRSTITKGEYEPNDDECQWPSDDEGMFLVFLQSQSVFLDTYIFLGISLMISFPLQNRYLGFKLHA